MSLPRVRLERCKRLDDGSWLLDKAQERHLVKALRCYDGAAVEGLSPEGGVKFLMRLSRRGDSFVLCAVESISAELDAPSITLLIGLLKSDQFDSLLRASAELGVGIVQPLICDRSVPRMDDGTTDRKMPRWQRILDEGTKVSGAVFPPQIQKPIKFDDYDFASLPEARYAALLCGAARPLRDVAPGGGRIAIAIGPEGDWSDGEAESLLASGFLPISLGRRVLRASTAAVVACGWFGIMRA